MATEKEWTEAAMTHGDPWMAVELGDAKKRIGELEDALRGIFSMVYDPEGMKTDDVLEGVMCRAAEAVGIKYPPQ